MTRWTQLEITQLRDLIAQGKNSSEVAEIMDKSQKSVLSVALHHKLGPWKSSAVRQPKPDRDSLAARMITATMPELATILTSVCSSSCAPALTPTAQFQTPHSKIG
ncbi:hypothetical protein AV944_11100 [Sphingomonas sp. LK11]|uniref:hypothetical protein n=1 Tax=Sphingomonas sp. LK11 TaxID=1390395 RepID=UPI0009729C49|nr:hypothetical protein [Sphingomonas sp. LK11]APX66286.1 hypothetical protein AV944_11100 [Sphingomonas sp. LK11]